MPELGEDARGYPSVFIPVGEVGVSLQFDSGIGALGSTLSQDPPTVHGISAERVHVTPHNASAQWRTKLGEFRIEGYAPGVKCAFEAFAAGQAASAPTEQIFTICSSLRAPAPGPWRAPTQAERKSGMTFVPDGAWVESSPPQHPGRYLRSDGFRARLYAGSFVVSSMDCPASFEDLESADLDRESVALRRTESAGGPVWIREVSKSWDGHAFPGETRIIAPRDGTCCTLTFVPWLTQPSEAQIHYAAALCDTFESGV